MRPPPNYRASYPTVKNISKIISFAVTFEFTKTVIPRKFKTLYETKVSYSCH